MKIGFKKLESRLNRFKADLQQAGVKLTHQRLEIFKEVASSENHPDVETIFKGIRKRLPTVSLDTVYRTLHLMSDLGLIDTLGTPKHGVRFDANIVAHHHFVCTRCGAIRDFYSYDLDRLELPDSVLSIGHAVKTQVEVKGTCHKCAGEKKPGAKKNNERR